MGASETADRGGLHLHFGDCLEVMKGLPDSSIDAVVTDPPYDLTAGKKGGSGESSDNPDSPAGRSRIGTGMKRKGGFMNRSWDATGIAFRPETWAEVLRVLKPGGYLLAFGGSRTWHRLACAIEDAGFELRDSIMWVHGEGFPKSLDVSKAIDRAQGVDRKKIPVGKPLKRMIPGADQNRTGSWLKENGRVFVPSVEVPATEQARVWQGWGTSLKPAMEPVTVARRPLSESSVAGNVLRHGTGAIHIDACRIPGPKGNGQWGSSNERWGKGSGQMFNNSPEGDEFRSEEHPLGRWPANVVLSHSPGCQEGGPCSEGCPVLILDRESGVLKSGTGAVKRTSGKGYRPNAFGAENRPPETEMIYYGDQGGASRFFYCAKADASERLSWCSTCSVAVRQSDPGRSRDCPIHGDSAAAALGPLFGAGVAERCSCPETAPKEHDGHEIESHPTVKPLSLCRWLVRLVARPGGTVLDPFMGSGSTGVACAHEGMKFVGIDNQRPYFEIAKARMTDARPTEALSARKLKAMRGTP